MWRLFVRYTLLVILASLIAIIQASLFSAWPFFFSQINLVLIAAIFALFFFGSEIAWWLSFVFGFWLGMIYFQFFGFWLLVLIVTVLLSRLLLKNWLTNRSLYSFLVLILAATLIYNFLAAAILSFLPGDGSFFLIQGIFWKSLIYQGFWSLIAGLLLYHLTAALTHELKPFFLESRKRL